MSVASAPKPNDPLKEVVAREFEHLKDATRQIQSEREELAAKPLSIKQIFIDLRTRSTNKTNATAR